MDLTKLEENRVYMQNLLPEFTNGPKDVGSPAYQVIRLTYEIQALDTHARVHKKDYSAHRRLTVLVSKRKKFQAYLIKNGYEKYEKLTQALGLRK